MARPGNRIQEVPARAKTEGGPPEIEGFLLVERIPYVPELGNEILIGVKESLAFGPVISFSKGGSDAEHFARNYSSPNVKLLPLPREECAAMLEEDEQRQSMREALQRLAPDLRTVLVLRYFHDLDSKEIGRILELSDSTVRSRLRTARQRLATAFKKLGREQDGTPKAT